MIELVRGCDDRVIFIVTYVSHWHYVTSKQNNRPQFFFSICFTEMFEPVWPISMATKEKKQRRYLKEKETGFFIKNVL